MPRKRFDLLRDRLAQLGLTERRAVVRPTLVEGALGRVADVHGRVEVGLTDLQVDDVPALRLERAGSGGGLESRLSADTDHALCKLHARHRSKGCIERRPQISRRNIRAEQWH